jgi:hypothetical protein
VSALAGYRQAVENLKSIKLLAADGSMKSLLDSSRADLGKWERQSAVRAASRQERNEWFDHAARAFEEAGAEKVSDLPPEKIRELATHAERV